MSKETEAKRQLDFCPTLARAMLTKIVTDKGRVVQVGWASANGFIKSIESGAFSGEEVQVHQSLGQNNGDRGPVRDESQKLYCTTPRCQS